MNPAQAPDVVFLLLSGAAVLLSMGAVTFFGAGAWELVLARFLTEVRGETAGSIRGAGRVLLRKMGSMNRRFMWPAFEAKLRHELVKAGDPQGFAPEDILSLQELSFVAGLIGGVIVADGLGQNLCWSLVGGLLGALYPLIWVSDQVKKRSLLISRALPYSLDLLTLSVEAGLDFNTALSKVVEKGRAGPLRDELQLVLKQLKMGKTREEALKAMILRVELPSLSSFVTALIQADRMGTSLGKVLRIQSTQLRIERTQRAEKRANEAPVKMLFPLILCIFPTVFMILFGPIVFAMLFGNAAG